MKNTESNGAKLSISEKSTKSNQIQTNASSIYVHAGIETNNYIITGWVDNKEIIASTNISVHVFPYEIDTPDQIVRSHSIKSAPISVETLPEYDSHLWKLEKAFNVSGGTSEEDDGKIGISPNLINSTELNSDKIYYKAGMAGEKYNLTATHELYTNVTDTVEFRTCDIFFNPISCESISGFKVVNPRGFVYNDETHYKLEIEPKSFLYNSVVWEGTTSLIVTPRDEKNLYVGLNTAQGPGEYFDNEITIQIPDYYESPPNFTVRIYNCYKTISVKPIIIKYSQNQYPDVSINDSSWVTDQFYTSNQFYNVFYPKFQNIKNYVNCIYKQAGINFEFEEITEVINQDFFNWSCDLDDNYVREATDSYDGIVMNIIDKITNNKHVNEEAFTLMDSSQKPVCVVVDKKSDILSVPHEFGHALGLLDIYNSENSFDFIPSENHLPNDYTGELNYYNLKLNEIITHSLMNGVLNKSSKQIISLGNIWGSSSPTNNINQQHFPVGLSSINTDVTTYGLQ